MSQPLSSENVRPVSDSIVDDNFYLLKKTILQDSYTKNSTVLLVSNKDFFIA